MIIGHILRHDSLLKSIINGSNGRERRMEYVKQIVKNMGKEKYGDLKISSHNKEPQKRQLGELQQTMNRMIND